MAIFSKKTEPKKKSAAKKADPKVEAKSMKELYSEAPAGNAAAVKQAGSSAKVGAGNAYKVLVKPLVTEKVSNLGALNKYVFAVAMNANKIEVAKAIKEIYNVEPLSVNIIRLGGKKARYGRSLGRRKDWKKAIVTLPAGQTIKVYEGV